VIKKDIAGGEKSDAFWLRMTHKDVVQTAYG
jgi:hypothetical protein